MGVPGLFALLSPRLVSSTQIKCSACGESYLPEITHKWHFIDGENVMRFGVKPSDTPILNHSFSKTYDLATNKFLSNHILLEKIPISKRYVATIGEPHKVFVNGKIQTCWKEHK